MPGVDSDVRFTIRRETWGTVSDFVDPDGNRCSACDEGLFLPLFPRQDSAIPCLRAQGPSWPFSQCRAWRALGGVPQKVARTGSQVAGGIT